MLGDNVSPVDTRECASTSLGGGLRLIVDGRVEACLEAASRAAMAPNTEEGCGESVGSGIGLDGRAGRDVWVGKVGLRAGSGGLPFARATLGKLDSIAVTSPIGPSSSNSDSGAVSTTGRRGKEGALVDAIAGVVSTLALDRLGGGIAARYQ